VCGAAPPPPPPPLAPTGRGASPPPAARETLELGLGRAGGEPAHRTETADVHTLVGAAEADREARPEKTRSERECGALISSNARSSY